MSRRDTSERKLCRALDSAISEANALWPSNLNEGAMVERRISDVRLRNGLAKLICEEVLRCRKLCEQFSHDGIRDVEYTIGIVITAKDLRWFPTMRVRSR